MGCGIDFDTSLPSGYVYVFFTKNDIRFSEPIPMKQPPDGLYSLIGLYSKGDKVHYLGHWRRDLDQIQELMVTQEFPTSPQMHSNMPSGTSSYVDQSSHQLPSPDDTSNDNMIQSEVAIVEGNTLDSTNLSSLPVTHQPTNSQ
jgi:hypothetical protein